MAGRVPISLLTLFSMTKIWAEAFWKADPHEEGATRDRFVPEDGRMRLMYLSIAGMAFITLAIGAGAGFVYDLAERGAEQLLDSGAYRDAVLGRTGGDAR